LEAKKCEIKEGRRKGLAKEKEVIILLRELKFSLSCLTRAKKVKMQRG